MILLLLLPLLLPTSILASYPGPICQKPIDGSYYEFFDEGSDWPNARVKCEMEGGGLTLRGVSSLSVRGLPVENRLGTGVQQGFGAGHVLSICQEIFVKPWINL